MDGRQYFIDCCKERGIDCDVLFKVGRGTCCSRGRYIYDCSPMTRKPTQIFAIKYYEEERLYLAWDLRVNKAKSKRCFSLSKDKIPFNPSKENLQINKYIEYSGREEETVFIFSPKGIDEFLNNI